ncbi:MAG: carboxypeptidase-like regulatory domain-containing protein, partial [Segetibacter sp.]|nr:carboxypeptidase-like regulatory domain-containing protein [Segetibacter sp.]
MMWRIWSIVITILFAVSLPKQSAAQRKILKGIVKDRQSDEPIPFASVVFKISRQGTLTDSSGIFAFDYNGNAADTLFVTSVGYKPAALVIP